MKIRTRVQTLVRHVMPILMSVGLISGGIGGLSTSLSAQTKFLWPSDQFDVAQYKYIELCYALQARVTDSAESRSNFRDSLHYSKNNLTRELLPAVIAATKRCLQKFPPDQITPDNFSLAQELYLTAHDDASAKAVVDRRVRAIATLEPDVQMAHLDTMIELYYYAQPIRLSAAMELFDQMEALTKRMSTLRQVQLYARLIVIASNAGHDSTAIRVFPKITALVKSMTEEEFVGIPGQQSWWIMRSAMTTVYRDRILARLEESTRKYLDEPQVIFTELVGRAPPATPELNESLEEVAKSVGQPTQLYGDYWFPAKPDSVTYPRRGVVTVLNPVDENFGQTFERGNRESNWELVANRATYYRLKARWPELELVFLANTLGFLKVMEPPPPEREAVMLDSMYRHFYRLPGVLIVSKTDFWRLPGYDRRRINELTKNQQRGLAKPQTYVIDKEGVMVISTRATGSSEKLLENVIEVLMKRPYQGLARANAK